jgi:hypothetical protein
VKVVEEVKDTSLRGGRGVREVDRHSIGRFPGV